MFRQTLPSFLVHRDHLCNRRNKSNDEATILANYFDRLGNTINSEATILANYFDRLGSTINSKKETSFVLSWP